MPDGRRAWQLDNFGECLDAWVDQCSPSQDLQVIVTNWVFTLYDDPYAGARRFPDVDLYYRKVPGTADGTGLSMTAVFCSYTVNEETGRIFCASIATLGLPA